jgi:hypothetical protein
MKPTFYNKSQKSLLESGQIYHNNRRNERVQIKYFDISEEKGYHCGKELVFFDYLDLDLTRLDCLPTHTFEKMYKQ